MVAVALRKLLEKVWFSLLLIGLICIGVFRVFEDPQRKFIRKNGYDWRQDVSSARPQHFTEKDFSSGNRVTKALSLTRNGSGFSDHVLLFNRVPKSGSEMLILLLQWLQGPNGFRHVRIPGGEKRKLTILEQEELVEEITSLEKAEAIPISFDRHVYFINFTKFDKQWPIYVNLVREPLEKAVSRFYYGRVTPSLKNPDVRYAYSKGLIPRIKQKKQEVGTFEECVKMAYPECNFVTGNTYDLTIPYFCGQEELCRVLNNRWALQKAKKVIEAHFPVVGVLEELNTTLAVLENKIPMFFKGVQNVYFNELLEPHKNKNKWKVKSVDSFTREHLRKQLKDEYDLYYWIRMRLRKQHKEIMGYR